MITEPRHRGRKVCSAAFVAVLVLAAGRPMAALDGFGIEVRCSIDSGQMRNLYGPRRVAEITPKLCEALLASLIKDPELSLWSFGTAVRGG